MVKKTFYQRLISVFLAFSERPMDISNSAAALAYQGIQTGFNGLNENAKQLANPNHVDKTEALVGLKENENQVQASAKALKSADDRIGTLLDILA